MFTGIIEAVGKVVRLSQSGRERALTISNPFGSELKNGDSIAVDGACLTVTSFDDRQLSFFVSEQSVKKTRLAALTTGSLVNLERALAFGGRLDGHLVTGHIDTVSTVEHIEKIGKGIEIEVAVPALFAALTAPRGSIAVNGISLTIAELKGSNMLLTLIPETLARTAFAQGISRGEKVNLEFDIIAKYVGRLVGGTKTDYNRLFDML